MLRCINRLKCIQAIHICVKPKVMRIKPMTFCAVNAMLYKFSYRNGYKPLWNEEMRQSLPNTNHSTLMFLFFVNVGIVFENDDYFHITYCLYTCYCFNMDRSVNTASMKHSGSAENLHLSVAVVFSGVSHIQIHKVCLNF